MTPTLLIELMKKHGAFGVLAIWLFYTNQRLTEVEKELYRCYDKMTLTATDLKTRTPKGTTYFAVLPKEIKIKKNKA